MQIKFGKTLDQFCDSAVRFGPKADICSAKRDVRFTPESGHVRCNWGCLLWAKSGHRRTSSETCFSRAVRQTLQRFGNGLVEIGLEIGRGLHGKMPSRPLAKGERGRAFKAISPGMLLPLGIIFGLFCRVHW